MQSKKILLGAHLSIAGGLDQCLVRAQDLGLTAVQFFSKSNRQWRARPLTQSDIDRFKSTLAASSIKQTTIHASYLINIGSPKPETAQRSAQALADEYERALALDVDHLVFHPGSHLKDGQAACLDRIAQHINKILSEASTGKTKLVLETMAGQGSAVCYNFQQLAYILDRIEQKERVGVCFDTCHVFAAGYDIAQNYQEVMATFDEHIGFDYLSVIHLNDSKKPCGSRVDRHEHIGEGMIGPQAFAQLCTDERLKHVSKILETPKDSVEDDVKNINTIERLISS